MKGQGVNMDCIFCKIAQGIIPSNKVYEDDRIIAFYDLNPQAKVHVLVIPKLHITCADEINSDNSREIAYIFENIPKIAKAAGIVNGYRIISNCGDDGCQSVKHLHFHVIGGEKLSEKMA